MIINTITTKNENETIYDKDGYHDGGIRTE